jgi:hypothetical protein
MKSRMVRRSLLICVAAPLAALAGFASSGCGAPAEASASASPRVEATAPSTLAVNGRLLVVRSDSGAWRVERITPSSGDEEALATLPFRPHQALASPSRTNVLYVGAGRRLAVLDAATGVVRRIALDAYPIRSIDGVTWTSDAQVLFGGSRTAYADPEYSSLYKLDVASGSVSRFRGLQGGEPSYAAEKGSLIYVMRRSPARAPFPQTGLSKDYVRTTIRLLHSLSAKHATALTSDVAYIDAGRSFNTPLLSPDGKLILSSHTGTDVSVTYSLLDVGFLGSEFLTSYGPSWDVAAWGGHRVAFLQAAAPLSEGKLAVFVYDETDGSLTRYASAVIGQLDWSPDGDLVAGPGWNSGDVYASAAGTLGAWVDFGAGWVPVWVP